MIFLVIIWLVFNATIYLTVGPAWYGAEWTTLNSSLSKLMRGFAAFKSPKKIMKDALELAEHAQEGRPVVSEMSW